MKRTSDGSYIQGINETSFDRTFPWRFVVLNLTLDGPTDVVRNCILAKIIH